MIKLPAYGEDDERMLRSHLSLIHGTYVNDVKTPAGLVECHESQHADPDPHFQLTHEHTGFIQTDDVPDTPQGWEW